LVSGFWHGANWTFIVWGLLNALFIMPSIIFNTNRTNLDSVAQGKLIPTLKEFTSIILTFSLTVFAWIFFRSDTIVQAFEYISRLFSKSFFSIPAYKTEIYNTPILILLMLFVIVEWLGREQQYAIATLFSTKPRFYRWALYYLVIIIIFIFAGSNQQFIYFQF
jgi:D-alanyl-lipoteichoic acid acyltransferase DltB (MBOAT superfamily)